MSRLCGRWATLVGLALLLGASRDLLADDPLDKRISLELRKASAEELYPLFAQLLGAEPKVEIGTDKRVDLVFSGITLRTGLNAFCESIGCGWEVVPGAPLQLRFYVLDNVPKVLAESKRISVELVKASVADVLKLAGHILKADVLVDPALSEKTISIKRDEETVAAVLNEICIQVGCKWTIESGDPSTLKVTAQSQPH